MRVIWSFSKVESSDSERNKIQLGTENNWDYINSNLLFYANASNVFRHSPDTNSPINFILFCFVFSFKVNTAIFVVLSCKNNLIVYNIKYTYLSAFRSLVGSEWTFQGLCTCIVEREGMKVRWTRHRSFRFLCDKTKEISEVIN